ncbi:MAG TPA: hypothetical protein VLQ67_11665 [Arachnia sp.]|nr:hypothetical protein [Arachnia sp.]
MKAALTSGRVFALVALMAVALSAGCGSGSLPEITSLPSISMPARPTALPSLSRPTATATETATATATATVTVSASNEPPAETTPAESPSTEAPAEPAPEAEGSGLWWLLILLAIGAALAVAGIMWSRSRSAAKEIERRFALVRSDLSWADADLLPRVLASPSAAEASALWEAGRPRLLVAEEELRLLAVAGTDTAQQDRARQWRTALASLVTAVDVETSLPPSADAERLRSARAGVEEARRTLLTLLNEADQDS